MNKKIIRYALYGIEIMICFALQVTPAALPEVFGGKAVLLLSLALSFGVFEKELPAMLLAVVCGFLTDCAYSGTVGFYVIMLVIACFTISCYPFYQNPLIITLPFIQCVGRCNL